MPKFISMTGNSKKDETNGASSLLTPFEEVVDEDDTSEGRQNRHNENLYLPMRCQNNGQRMPNPKNKRKLGPAPAKRSSSFEQLLNLPQMVEQ